MPSSLFFLYGGAGVGKSAIAQSLCEKLQKSQLAASFFFGRSDPSRNNREQLFPTLISQLADTFKDIQPYILDKIRKNPALLTKRAEVQIQELLLEPLRLQLSDVARDTRPRLIIIDGLDESQVAHDRPECGLLRDIVMLIRESPYPFRFLITSRPEAPIMKIFNHNPCLQAMKVHRHNLSDDTDANEDIRTFLEEEFAKIRRDHRLGPHLSDTWPSHNKILSIVKRSSKHFIYASTAIRYIQSPNHRPDDRLDVILRIRPPQDGDRPFAQLDFCYKLIFNGVENRGQLEKICLVLGVLYFQSRNFARVRGCNIEKLLDMKAGGLELLLDPIISLVSIDSHDDKVRILHKSLFEYLLDIDRSGYLPFDLMRAHTVAATHILKQITVNPVVGALFSPLSVQIR